MESKLSGLCFQRADVRFSPVNKASLEAGGVFGFIGGATAATWIWDGSGCAESWCWTS